MEVMVRMRRMLSRSNLIFLNRREIQYRFVFKLNVLKYLNKRNFIQHCDTLSLFKCHIKNSVSKQLNNTKFRLIQNHLFIRKMATARLAGKTIDDVLYPNIEPHKTGMLQVCRLPEKYYLNHAISYG